MLHACLVLAAAVSSAPVPPGAAVELARLVNPLIGTGGMVPAPPGKILDYTALGKETPQPFGGLTVPGATLPFGMVALSPDSATDGFAWSGGKNAYDRTILGFSHMHQSGNGLAYGHFLFVPTAGPLQLDPGTAEAPETGYRSRFRLETEHADAGSYQVRLDDHGIDVALTVTTRVGFHRYTFPATPNAHVIIDLEHAIGRWKSVKLATVKIEGDRTVTGSRESDGRGGGRPFFFAAAFSRPFASFGVAAEGKAPTADRVASGKKIKAFLNFDTTSDRVVMIKVAISPVSLEGARHNLAAELPGWDFEAARTAAHQTWDQALGKIAVQGGTEEQRRIFYTALYHAQLAPFVLGDADGTHRTASGEIRKDDFTNYTFFSLWDTFRSQNPLLTLIAPQRVPDMIRSMMAMAEGGGRGLPGAGLAGYHAAPVIADAYLKGITGFDAERAFAMVKETLMNDRRGLATYKEKGWVAADAEPRAAAHTLEYAVDDFAAAQMAHRLGKTLDEAYFRKRAGNWRNVIDAKVGFARGRMADGSWRTPFDPRAVSHYQKDQDFVEANSWQYTFFVPHDGKGLVAALGGRKAFVAKLDQLFDQPPVLTGTYSADVSGLWGQYAAGNEQSHQIAYMYAWAGAPWKTQWRVREIMKRFYTNQPDGLPGNDDAGATSAWYVWSAMGFYPVNPVGGIYVLGSPLFEEVNVDVGGGKRFKVTAPHNSATNVYIQSARLNGQPLHRTWISHAEMVAGGTLELVMGPRPNRQWGAAPGDAPPSLSDAHL